MDKIIITGGTGFIGLSLAEHLSKKGLRPILIARNRPERKTEFDFVEWDAVNLGNWVDSINGALAIVNLTGRSVDCIKTPDNCDVILRSRVDSTCVIGAALKEVQNPPKSWIQMSTAHIYGDPPSAVCTENSATGYGLAPFVGKAWEEALLRSKPEGVREVRLRTSFVIGRNGGALSTLKKLAKLGLGGKIGNGRQGLSWIHEYDMNEIFYRAITEQNFNGVYIASSPNPVSNAAFMKALRRNLKVPIGIPSPEWITRLGARILFKTDPELAIYGRYVKPERLEAEGFRFAFPGLEEALNDLLG